MADPRETLGRYTAPVGLYERTKALPFLGRVTSSHDRLVAGAREEIVLDYEVGASGIADGARFKITFKFYSDWALFQTTDRTAADYVSAEYVPAPLVAGQSPATVHALKVRFDQKGHERPFQKAIIVDPIDGYVNPGDRIRVRLGDRRFGGPGTRVQTFVEEGFRFRAYVDPLGTSRLAAVEGDVVLDVVPGAPAKLVAVGPRIVRRGERFTLRVRVEDAWGNTCRDLAAARVAVEADLDGTSVARALHDVASEGWAVTRVDDLPSDAAGELLVRVRLDGAPNVEPATFPVTIATDSPVPRSFYADLHVHSEDTIGTNDTTYNLTYGRDVAGLDVLGYTANDFNVTKERWDRSVALINGIDDPGRFVCYAGTEWCGNSAAGGDHNVVFLRGGTPEFPFDRAGRNVRSFEWNEAMLQHTIVPGAWPLEELWAAYAHDPEGHLLIPHVGGRRCNLDWHYPDLERLIEVGSSWGHFPWLYEEAIRRGYRMGASAAGDEHRGRCGGGVPGTAVFGTKGGLTGVVASELTRAAIGTALRAGHTWATTGERLVGLARAGDHIQGDAFRASAPVPVAYRFLGDAGWDTIEAYDHTGLFWRRDLQQEAGWSERRLRIRWGGARIRDRYRWATWNGTITVSNGTLVDFQGRGLEHGEESVWRAGPSSVGFRSETFGDTDAVELVVDGLADATIRIDATITGPFDGADPIRGVPLHDGQVSWEFRARDALEAGTLRRALGGEGLFLAAERLSDAPMPRDVAGEIVLDAANGPHGHRPVFFVARQVDDAKVWTSALYVTFET